MVSGLLQKRELRGGTLDVFHTAARRGACHYVATSTRPANEGAASTLLVAPGLRAPHYRRQQLARPAACVLLVDVTRDQQTHERESPRPHPLEHDRLPQPSADTAVLKKAVAFPPLLE